MGEDSPGKRRFQRVPFEGRLTIQDGGASYDARVLDLSLKGLLAICPESWNAPGGGRKSVELVLALEGGGEGIRMGGVVAHVAGDQVGFQWTDIGLEDFSRLRRLLTLNLGSDELVDRDLAELIAEHS